MCGIAGWVGSFASSRDEAERTLRAMTDALSHRGPDDAGYEFLGEAALGHRRLSIIDLAHGHQPMWSADRTRAIVFNGEIYDFMDQRAELERKGHRFSTRSDTEVLLALYAEHGEGMLERLHGMFAFALWDLRARRLFAARDRMGKKPLHYAFKDGTFVFGSEVKALLLHPRVGRNLDRAALIRYLVHEYVPAPRSIFRDIRKLPAGHALALEQGALRVWRYWPCPFTETEQVVDEDEAAERVRDLLRDSVVKRLVSDVPLGVFLSGGIDSSSVVALMAEAMPSRQIRTFSIAFREAKYDESSHARAVAERFGTSHHEDVLHPTRMLEILPEIVDRMDEPFADPSIVPTHLLCSMVRKHVTVALGGDGGDELFAGYPLPSWVRPARVLESILSPGARAWLDARARRLPPWLADRKAGYKLGRFASALPYPEEVCPHVWMSSFYPMMLVGLLAGVEDREIDDVYRALVECAAEAPSRDPLQRCLYLFYRTYLEGDILVKVDRASMMSSLEVRAPFLDVRLVEYVSRLPADLKLRGRTTKYLLKRAMRRALPESILNRPKKGFGVPLGKWFRGELREELRSVLSEERIRQGGLFRPDYVARLVEDHVSGRRDWRKPLWTLFVFEKWRQRWQPT